MISILEEFPLRKLIKMTNKDYDCHCWNNYPNENHRYYGCSDTPKKSGKWKCVDCYEYVGKLEEILKNTNFTDEEAEVFELLVADKSLEEVSQRLLISKTTTSRRVADIKEKIERSQAMINKVPIWEKVTLTIDEAAEYSNIGINRINDMLNNPSCPFVLFVGRGKRLVKRKEFEKYLEKTDSI